MFALPLVMQHCVYLDKIPEEIFTCLKYIITPVWDSDESDTIKQFFL